MKKSSRNEFMLSTPGGAFRVVQHFNAKGEEYRRQYYPISIKAVREADGVFRTKTGLLLQWYQSKSRLKEKEF